MNCPWENWLPATMSFCETNLCSIIRQPANTWSNIIYLIVGLVILKLRGLKNPVSIIGISSLLLFFGSSMFHASATFFFEIFDLAAMFLISSFMLALNAHRLWLVSFKKIWFIYSGLVISAVLINILEPSAGIAVFATHIAVALTIELVCHLKEMPVDYKSLLTSSLFFIIAFTAWSADINKLICNPNNHIINGHAIWHISNGISIYYLYRFYLNSLALTQNRAEAQND